MKNELRPPTIFHFSIEVITLKREMVCSYNKRMIGHQTSIIRKIRYQNADLKIQKAC